MRCVRRYTFKLYPTAEQRDRLATVANMCGELWNALLHMQIEMWRRTRGQRGVTHDPHGKPGMSNFDMGYHISELRKAIPEWDELSTWIPRRVAAQLALAMQAFMRRAKQGAGAQSGYPKFKSFKRGQHNWIPQRFASGCKMVHIGGTRWDVHLKGIGTIRARGEFPAEPIDWSDADLRLTAGTWWLSVCVEIERERPHGQSALNIDLGGIDQFAEINRRAIFANDLRLPERDPRIAELSRQMTESSFEGRPALRQRKARIEARQARQRRERLHEWTTALIAAASSISLTVPNDLIGAMKSGHGDEQQWGAAVELKAELNKALSSQALGSAAAMIRYKAAEAGIELVESKHDRLAVGNMAVEGGRALRKAKRAIKQRRGKHGERHRELRSAI